MRTGFAAVRFGWVAYVIPFLFVLSPGLLMEGGVTAVVIAIVTASIGVWLGSVGLIGYFVRPLSWPMRTVFMATGFCAMLPAEAFTAGLTFKLGGIALGGIVVIAELAIRRRAAVTSG